MEEVKPCYPLRIDSSSARSLAPVSGRAIWTKAILPLRAMTSTQLFSSS